MEYEFIEFKSGQSWKTRLGKRFIIKEVREDEEYAQLCNSMETGKKQFFDEDGLEVPGYPTDNDLVEQIS